MKKLVTKDVFAFCRCLKRIGIKEELKKRAEGSDNAADAFGTGFDFLWTLFDLATEVGGEGALYEFFAGPFEMTADEVANLPIKELFDDIKMLASENDLMGFFELAFKQTK